MNTLFTRKAGQISLLFLVLAGFFTTCQDKVDSKTSGEDPQIAENPRLKLHTAEESGLDFINQIVETKENNAFNNTNIYNGGGVAVADVNNDSLPDLYFVNCSGKNKLFLNQGNCKFKDATDGSGLESEGGFETSVTAVDINADGWMDFYVGRAGPYPAEQCKNRLFVNNGTLAANGNPTFTERSAEYGLDVDTRTTGTAFFDYDLDGDLDVFILNHPTTFDYITKMEARLDEKTNRYYPVLAPKTPWDSDRLYRNDGPLPASQQTGGAKWKFVDVSKQAGIQTFAYGLSVTISDFNGDQYPDIYVGNDFMQPDILFINNRNGTFSDQLGKYFKHTTQHTMGVDIADFDNDGLVDLMGVDMLPDKHARQKSTMNTLPQSTYNTFRQNNFAEAVVRNVLQHNNGNGTFSDIGCMAGVFKTDWSWSGLFMDLDNDGYKDLGITNGYRREISDLDFINFVIPDITKDGKVKLEYTNLEEVLAMIPTYKINNYLYRNRGDWTFEDVKGEWLTVLPSWSCGAAYADFDRDGDLDWVINNIEEPPFLYENLTRAMPNSNYLQISLTGAGQNPKAIGATATIYTGNQQQHQELSPTRGIFSSVEHLLHFGIGNQSKVDKVVVKWPDGKTTTLANIPANQRLVLRQADANGQSVEAPPPVVILKENTTASGVKFAHVENTYLDFDAFFLQPWKESELGPLMSKGDVNGDGLDDFFIGNAFGQSAGLYVQMPDGRFRPASEETWKQDISFEDHGSLFFDADLDGDQDLFVISGGAEAKVEFSNIAWQNRLYLNMDGKGTFAKVGGLPQTKDVAGRVVAHDYDQDGDPDLFIGGRMTPSRWPLTPRSTILRNDRNRFTDVTTEVAPDFERCGMVTDLVWANVDADPQPELIVTGEWMPIMVFKLSQRRLQNITTVLGLGQSNGLWNRLTISDLDKDGDLDIVAGNFGLNTRLSASVKEPLTCYAKDFDKNNSIDPLITYYEAGKEFPTFRQDALFKQLPALKKRFIYARDFGKATIEDIYPRSELDAALVLKAYTLATSWWENKGGKFIQHVLPTPAQVSPAYGLEVHDFNGDGNMDILLAGNKYGIEVETGKCDAGVGAMLLGDGRGGFSWLPNTQSGFWAPGEVRDLVVLRGAGGKTSVIVANNNGNAQVFQK